ncbi:hypothetical protein Avbf_14172 [Armadillidium vulgare]|nr:hypothetical protein Avbf_14172 [Armadillidium vulgare]
MKNFKDFSGYLSATTVHTNTMSPAKSMIPPSSLLVNKCHVQIYILTFILRYFSFSEEEMIPPMDLKGAEIEFESEEKMFFKKISESEYPKVAVGKLSEKEIKVCSNFYIVKTLFKLETSQRLQHGELESFLLIIYTQFLSMVSSLSNSCQIRYSAVLSCHFTGWCFAGECSLCIFICLGFNDFVTNISEDSQVSHIFEQPLPGNHILNNSSNYTRRTSHHGVIPIASALHLLKY